MNTASQMLPPPAARPIPAWKKHWKAAAVITVVAAGFALVRPQGDDARTRALYALDQSGVVLSMQGGKLDMAVFNLKPGIEERNSNLAWAFHQLARFPEISKLETAFLLPPSVATLRKLTNLTSFKVNERTDLEDEHFAGFAGMTNLESLEIQGDKLTPDALKHLEGLQNLKTLKIGGENLLGPGFERVCRIPNLERLSIERGSSKRGAPVRFEPGSKLKSIRFALIDLSKGTVQGLENLQSLEELYLWQASVDPSFFEGLRKLPRLKVLRVLSGQGTFDDSAGIVASYPSLESLSLHNAFGDATNGWLTAAGSRQLARSTTIKNLELFNTSVGDDGVKAIAGMDGLKSLRLNRVGMTNRSFDDLKKLRSLETLQILEPQWWNMRGAVPEEFARFQEEVKRLNKTEATIDRGWVNW